MPGTEKEKTGFYKEYRQEQQQEKKILTKEYLSLAYRQHVELFYGTVGKLGVVGLGQSCLIGQVVGQGEAVVGRGVILGVPVPAVVDVVHSPVVQTL